MKGHAQKGHKKKGKGKPKATAVASLDKEARDKAQRLEPKRPVVTSAEVSQAVLQEWGPEAHADFVRVVVPAAMDSTHPHQFLLWWLAEQRSSRAQQEEVGNDAGSALGIESLD